MGQSNVALASVAFLGIVAAFLLLLVHIAGKRWTAKGRPYGVDPKA